MSVHPVELERLSDRQLAITWNDGLQQRIAYRRLRDSCPCATCRQPDPPGQGQDAGGLRVLSAAETQPLDIVAMSPVGNYAYNIQFSDGHNTGIFTYDHLRSLAAAE
ncbi:MAG: DUF971 domain-containing protein [Pirellulaceae bacterium]